MGLRSDIIGLLTSSDVTLTDFTLFGNRICGADYRNIAECIRNGHIQIVRSGTLPSTNAAYNRTRNCMTVGARPSDSLIVHEATHAINDWHHRTLPATDDEALAYVAQMIFVCRQMPDVRRAALSSETSRGIADATATCRRAGQLCTESTVGYAVRVAATLMDGRTPSAQMLQDLRSALAIDPNTLAEDSSRIYTGIVRTEIPYAYLIQVNGAIVTD